MIESEYIASSQNQFIKMLGALRQKKNREELGLFTVEGVRLAEEAAKSDWNIVACLFTEEIELDNRGQALLKAMFERKCRMVKTSAKTFGKISDTEQPQGIMVLIEKRTFSLEDLGSKEMKPLIAVLDGIQDPGNIGAILRTADAAGCTGVIMTQGCADLFAGKTVRASMGSIFHLPVFEGVSSNQLIVFLKNRDIALMSTSLESSTVYFDTDLTGSVAVVFGNEGQGVRPEILEESEARLHIPIYGQAESLNVAASAAVILYEAARQRRFAL